KSRSEKMPASTPSRNTEHSANIAGHHGLRDFQNRLIDVGAISILILNQVADVHLPPPRPDIPGQPQRRCTAARVYDETRLNGRGRLAAGFAPAPCTHAWMSVDR